MGSELRALVEVMTDDQLDILQGIVLDEMARRARVLAPQLVLAGGWNDDQIAGWKTSGKTVGAPRQRSE